MSTRSRHGLTGYDFPGASSDNGNVARSTTFPTQITCLSEKCCIPYNKFRTAKRRSLKMLYFRQHFGRKPSVPSHNVAVFATIRTSPELQRAQPHRINQHKKKLSLALTGPQGQLPFLAQPQLVGCSPSCGCGCGCAAGLCLKIGTNIIAPSSMMIPDTA